MRVLLGSGYFESELPSYREYSYSKELAALGHEVTLMCGDQSQTWAKSRVAFPLSVPARCDHEFGRATGVSVVRRHVFFRVSDFVLYLPDIRAIRNADVVHVIEFRQGVTLLIALLARLFGKPVVYDHEQRGNRTEKWYSRVDSQFRRLLILTGSFLVSCVRHTVVANRDHFRSCTPRRVEEIFAPLGTDPQRFFHDVNERAAVREELHIAQDARVAIMSGKLHGLKKVIDVVIACRRANVRLILVGNMTSEVAASIAALPPGNEVLLAQAGPDGLRRLYNAADMAIFTTFTVSYWEAHATGLHLVIPEGPFSKLVFDNDPAVTVFGDASMFTVPDEQYRADKDISDDIYRAVSRVRPAARSSRRQFSAPDQGRRLADLYLRLVAATKTEDVA